MIVFLETDRLILRRFTADDIGLIVELDSDPEVKRYIDNGAPVDLVDLDETMEWWLRYYVKFEGYGFWAAIEKATDEFIGWFHYRPRHGDGPLEPELGYRLRRAAWGRGFGTEGSAALIDKGFREFGVQRVYAQTMVVHTASRRVMEKAGLRYIRTFDTEWPIRIPGDQEGDVEYALTRAEWHTANSGK